MWKSLTLALALLSPAPDPRPAALHFASERATVWEGRGAVLHFHLDEPTAEELVWPASVEPPGVVEVLRAPTALAGESRGTVRVRALASGACTLTVGERRLPLTVRALGVGARVHRAEPVIVAPPDGAVVWGRFTVAVEVPRDAGETARVRLELPGGDLLAPDDVDSGRGDFWRRLLFHVDSSALPEGAQTLHAIADRGGLPTAASCVGLVVAHPAADALLSGECEATLDAPRPEAFGAGVPRVGGGTDASGERYVVQDRPDPQWLLPLEVPADGAYQLVLRMRGDAGAGAFPSVGVGVDRPYPLLGSTRVVDHRWHRLPIGRPLALAAGTHHLGVRLLNEQNVGPRSDRNLFLDRWELLRVDEAATRLAQRGGGPSGRGEASLWVAFEEAFDGLPMNGRLEILGACNWTGPDDSPAPTVELLVDGATVARQQSARPRFVLDRAALGPGTHELTLAAELPDGRRATTPVQRLHVPGPVAAAPPREVLRFDVLDERWDDALRRTLDAQGEEPRQRVARPRQPVACALELPDELAGEFEVFVEARGPGGDAAAHVRLKLDGESEDELDVEVRNWWADRPAGRVTLAAGAKRLLVTLEPDAEDPQLRLRGLLLRRVARGPDRSPPTARLLYPHAGHVAHGVDALVVESFDDDALASADVLLDGRPQGTFGYVPSGAGHVVLPLLLRDVAPGAHTVAVRVVDREGNLGETAPISIQVRSNAPETPGPYARAVHLLNRLAFGPEPEELAKLLASGEDAWLDDALAQTCGGDRAARGLADTRLGDRIAYDAERLTLSYALRTNDPLRARFVLWIENHFSTWSGKTGAPSEWAEQREFARLGLAPFGELLLASATSPTMLVFLDQPQSYAGRLNENYARELLELHTLGLDGGYSQEEVTELARLLCGLTVTQEAPSDGAGNYQRRVLRFDPDLSDGRPCTLLGARFEAAAPEDRFDRVREALELLASHPSTARFVATKLVEHTVSAPAPEPLVADLARVYLERGGDLRALLRALARHPLFWSAIDAPRLSTPLDFGLRVARTTGLPQVDYSLREFLRNSGQGLFDRATPDGYPEEDAAWADTNGLMQRWRWVQDVPWAVRTLVPDLSRRYAGGDPLAWAQRAVDHAAVRLTGWTLGESSNAAALKYLQEDEGPAWRRIDAVTQLVCRLPEANLK